MVEVEELEVRAPAQGKSLFAWLFGVLVKPARTLRAITAEDKPVWLLPLLILSVLSLGIIFATGSLRLEAARSVPPDLPEYFQYMSPEQQEQFMQAQETRNGPMMIYGFPAIGALIGVWAGWFILGGILHLILTMLGSRGTSVAAFNLAAWSSLPTAIRLIVQIIAALAARQLVVNPGLSGFVAGDAAGPLLFARLLLKLVDIYLIWQIVLLWIGASSSAGISRGKALSGVLIAVLLVMVLSTLPSFFAAQLNGLDVNSPFFFF